MIRSPPLKNIASEQAETEPVWTQTPNLGFWNNKNRKNQPFSSLTKESLRGSKALFSKCRKLGAQCKLETKIYQKWSIVLLQILKVWSSCLFYKEWLDSSIFKGRCFVSISLSNWVSNLLKGIQWIRISQLTHKRHSQIMIIGCWDYSAHYFKAAKFRTIWEENSKAAATFADSFMWDTRSYNPFFSVDVKGPRPLISTISYCVHYSAQNRGRDTFLERFTRSEGGRIPAPRALISWTPPFLWLRWPQRQPFPLIDLLASPLSPGDRGPGTSACAPA